MKAIFKYKDKTLINEKIEDVALMLVFDEEFIEHIYSLNDNIEEFVDEVLSSETNIYDIASIGIEAPCDDFVYLYNECFTGNGEEGLYPQNKEELQSLIDTYNETLKAFDEKQVRVMVRSNDLWEDCNEKDFSLEEFLSMFKLM